MNIETKLWYVMQIKTRLQIARDIKIQYKRLSSHDWFMLANLYNTSYPYTDQDKLRLLFKHEIKEGNR